MEVAVVVVAAAEVVKLVVGVELIAVLLVVGVVVNLKTCMGLVGLVQVAVEVMLLKIPMK